MACFKAKTFCCRFDVRTGTTILIAIISFLSSIALVESVFQPHLKHVPTSDEFVINDSEVVIKNGATYYVEKEYSYAWIALELMVFTCCVSGSYSVMNNRKMFLMPFILTIFGVFLAAVVLSCFLSLFVCGIAYDMVYHMFNTSTVQKTWNRLKGDEKQADVDFVTSLGPFGPLFVLLAFIACLSSIVCFWHFLKVVWSLYKEMKEQEKNGMTERQSAMYGYFPTAPSEV